MFPVIASEPEMVVSNVQSCSHEKELFVLLVQTGEKMAFHVLVKNKNDRSPGIEPGFQLGSDNIKLNSVRVRIGLYLFPLCVFSAPAFCV